MNIGVDIKAFMYGASGISRYIRCILDELQRIDVDNRYFLFECRDSGYAPSNPGWRRVTRGRRLPGTLWQQFVLPRLLRKYGIDVLWAPEQICPVLGVPAHVKIATTVHDFAVLKYPEMVQAVTLAIKKVLIPAAIKKSAALLPVSEYIREELIRFYPYVQPAGKVIKVAGNGAKDWGSAVKPAKRENFLFFPANLEPRKNHLRLLNALEKVHAAGHKIGLRLAGPCGWDNAELHRRINGGPQKDYIRYMGFISDDELLNQYLTCAAVIFPSVYEGFGIPVLEALRLGTPVLTSKGTVMEEIAGANAMYFDPHDENSIAETIINFLESGGPVIDQASLGRYTWRRSAEDLLGVFNELGRECR